MKASAPWVKLVLIASTVALLAIVLARIGFLVDERRGYQGQAVESVEQSHAGRQALLGPVLRRECSEVWQAASGDGAARVLETRRRDFALQAVPQRLEVQSETVGDPRYRGQFRVNSYVATVNLQARWDELENLRAPAQNPGGSVSCKPLRLWVGVADVRGVRSAQVQTAAGQSRPVLPGTGHDRPAEGLQAELPGWPTDGSLPPEGVDLRVSMQLVGTGQFSVVPAADATQWILRSDWPHPSFSGRFLPTQREVGDAGFTATWNVSALATNAPRDVLRGVALCAGAAHGVGAPSAAADATRPAGCLDTLTVDFMDPVNPYSLTDRAIKYGLLFVLLTFSAVGLVEALGGQRMQRVHPIQYALVGFALCTFFMLLLGLSEHLSFALAYAMASVAVVALLGFYARHMLGSWPAGVALGGAIGLLYGLVYVLLQLEQAALLIGSLGLFLCLSIIMVLTKKVDWYGLGAARELPLEPSATAVASATLKTESS
jgi:inner membrane protein